MKRWWTGPHREAVPRGDVAHNASHGCVLSFISGTLRLALAQAISLTDLLRPCGASVPTQHVAPASPATKNGGYQSGYETWMSRRTSNEINRIERTCC
jgi:hypothetical protein